MNFTDPAIAGQFWVVNDNVMGGRSNSRVVAHPDGVIFEGMVSLENNGGFASIRCQANFLEGTGVLRLTARGDGKHYQLILRTDVSRMAPLYKCQFVASNEWHTHEFHPHHFEASFRGSPVDAPPLIFAETREFGVLIADKQAGAFQLVLRELLSN